MIIDRVTITGADNKTDCSDLYKLQNKYPFVEWGILFSKSKAGQPRYPTPDWMRFNISDRLNLSAHFCGWWSRMVMEHAEVNLLDDAKAMGFKRIQINYNFYQSEGWSFASIIDWLESNQDVAIILQHNKSNSPSLNGKLSIKGFPSNIHVLYDSSGGRGTVISDLEGKMPFHGHYTGYSGGLNPDNVELFCSELCNFIFNDKVWIDMESGVRTSNDFDLKKVETVLDTVEKYINIIW